MTKIITAYCPTPEAIVKKHSDLLLECLNYYLPAHPELGAVIDLVEQGKTSFSSSHLLLVKTAAYNYALTCKHDMRATYLHIAVVFDPDAKSFLNSEV